MLIPLQDYLPVVVYHNHHNLDIGGVLFSDILYPTNSIFIATNDATDQLTTTYDTPVPLLNNILSNFDIKQHPITTILTSYCLVTACDMIPFVPCQPLAIALGAKLGFSIAFPITALGQCTAGILAFTSARQLSNNMTNNTSDKVSGKKKTTIYSTDKLSPEALQKLQEFRSLTSTEEQGNIKILLALIGLRLAPFFPFSAGNYLLGGTTSVPLSLFSVATLFGCLLSNFLSVSLGSAGGALLLSSDAVCDIMM